MFEDGGSEVVMPLVLCRHAGGPYDDEAFASGWRLGSIAATLTHPGFSALVVSIRPIERLQADLLAMACGYTMAVDHGDADWLSVTFTRVDDRADALGPVQR